MNSQISKQENVSPKRREKLIHCFKRENLFEKMLRTGKAKKEH
jgi:hypothetical protein